MIRLALIAALLTMPAAAQVCYRQPFPNPDLADGFGSRCCGRTAPHRGLDYPQRTGTPIPAVGAGTVVVNTWNGCLGNVIVVRHDDGWYSGYSHMAVRASHGVGARVSMGEPIGQVGNTGSCSQGAHLHLTMSAYLEGYWRDPTVDPYSFINARTVCNRAPVGALDVASCTNIAGWTQDPDAPTRSIAAHVYIGGPAGTAGVRAIPTTADKYRSDLCSTVGCAHGFSIPVPPAYFDGRERPVYVYGIDASGGTNPLLQHAPKTLKCTSAELPSTAGLVRRPVSAAAFAGWKFDLNDVAVMTDANIDALELGPPLPIAPTLVKETGTDEVLVYEARVVRPVATKTAFTAFRFQASSVAPQTAGSLDEALRGVEWPSTPFLVKNSAGALYFLDAPPPLWAEVVASHWPARVVVGTSTEVSIVLRNRGSLTWTNAVSLQSPRDLPSVVCDPSWSSCFTAASVEGLVATGEETTLRFQLRAPKAPGEVRACFRLRAATHGFSDPAQNGPADDSLCWTVEVDEAPSAPDDDTSPAVDGRVSVDAPEAPVGRGCSATTGIDLGGALLFLLVALRRIR